MPIPKVGDVITVNVKPDAHSALIRIDHQSFVVTQADGNSLVVRLRLKELHAGKDLKGSPWRNGEDWLLYPDEYTINPFLTAACKAILNSKEKT